MIRHELDSPNMGGHLPHHSTLCYNLPLRRSEMGCGCKGNWISYLAYLRSDLRTPLPLKKPNRLKPAFVAVKRKFLDRPGPPR
ncbi:hypothetical protein AVEN_178448-1 [Araneus ventricosus]|uniref:Uncharacterized protein n=1 Tax=Araneus ventricosus TaxID=182803 RepID=A0A4Y2IAG9_ARAVE|nr:hypothetical protein AVEN_178448-1 [Araneus ventricosus]